MKCTVNKPYLCVCNYTCPDDDSVVLGRSLKILDSTQVSLEFPCIVLTFLTLIYCWDVSGFVTDSPYDPYPLYAGSFLDTSILNKIFYFHFHISDSYLHTLYFHLQLTCEFCLLRYHAPDAGARVIRSSQWVPCEP